MRGSIVKRGAGYSYVLYLGRGEDGRKQQKWVSGFRTKRSAEDALGEALGRISVGQFSDPGRITVGEFLDQWIDAASSGLRASTAASYRMLLVKAGQSTHRTHPPGLTHPRTPDQALRHAARRGRQGRRTSIRTVGSLHPHGPGQGSWRRSRLGTAGEEPSSVRQTSQGGEARDVGVVYRGREEVPRRCPG